LEKSLEKKYPQKGERGGSPFGDWSKGERAQSGPVFRGQKAILAPPKARKPSIVLTAKISSFLESAECCGRTR